jgi:hypothetical protein
MRNCKAVHPVRLTARWINGSFRGTGKDDKTQPKTVLSYPGASACPIRQENLQYQPFAPQTHHLLIFSKYTQDTQFRTFLPTPNPSMFHKVSTTPGPPRPIRSRDDTYQTASSCTPAHFTLRSPVRPRLKLNPRPCSSSHRLDQRCASQKAESAARPALLPHAWSTLPETG